MPEILQTLFFPDTVYVNADCKTCASLGGLLASFYRNCDRGFVESIQRRINSASLCDFGHVIRQPHYNQGRSQKYVLGRYKSLVLIRAGFKEGPKGPGPQAPHQQRAPHQTLYIILVYIVESFYINFNSEILYRIYLHKRLPI